MQATMMFNQVVRYLAISASVGIVPLLSNSIAFAQSADTVGNTGIQFEVPTIVEFEFVESNGAYQSTFGVINLDTGERTPLLVEVKPADNFQPVNQPSDYETDLGLTQRDDFLGTPGNAVPQPLAEYEFRPNTRYAFFLESSFNGRPVGTLYSTDFQNPGNNRQVSFEGSFANLANGGLVIRWDDTGSALVQANQQDTDFDDFIVKVGGHLDCPFGQTSNRSQKLKIKADNLKQNQFLRCKDVAEPAQ